MQVFKYALRVVFRNPILLIIYAVCLSFMGIAIASGTVSNASDSGEYERLHVGVAIIDRDNSTISQGIESYLAEKGELVPIEDKTIALQDAVAKDQVGYILIIPAGFGEQFVDAVETGEELPQLEAIYSCYSTEGALMDSALANYVSALQTHVMVDGSSDLTQLTHDASASASKVAQTEVVREEGDSTLPDRYAFFLKFDIYVFITSIVVCLGALLSTLNSTDVRRRNLVAPVSNLSVSLQTGLACLFITVLIWLFVLVLGALAFPDSVAAIGGEGLALIALTTFCFTLVCLGIAFLVGQCGVGATAANAIGNIGGLVISFLGGSWIPLEIAGPEVATVAHFLPGLWYTDALSRAAHIGAGGMDQIAPIFADLGVLLLFAVALFCIGLVIGKMRVQTAEAGGNAAAHIAAYGTN